MDAKQFISQVVDFLNVLFSLTVETVKKRTVIRMTTDQLRQFLLEWKFGAQPASVQYVTEPYLIAEGKAKFGKVTKIGAVQAMLGYDYEKNVISRREKEGVTDPEAFKAQPLWGGYGHVLSSALVEREVTVNRQKNGEKFKVKTGEVIFYLRYRHLNTLKGLHFDSAMNFLPASLVKPFFKPYYAPKNQGVEETIEARTLKLENIRRLRFKGMEIQVIPA